MSLISLKLTAILAAASNPAATPGSTGILGAASNPAATTDRAENLAWHGQSEGWFVVGNGQCQGPGYYMSGGSTSGPETPTAFGGLGITVDDCKARCRATPGCTFISWHSNAKQAANLGLQCALYTQCGPRLNTSGAGAGYTTFSYLEPTLVEENYTNTTPSFPGAYTVSVGGEHSCAVEHSTGAVVCWGQGVYGQLGDNTGSSTDVPVKVQGLGPAISVSAGGLHSCAVEVTGVTKCWGKGEDGQLGFGGRSRRWDARHVPYVGLALNVSAGGSHTCALEQTGDVRCWGYGELGQLGHGLLLDSLYPVLVKGLGPVIDVCTGGLHSCAAEKNGKVKCWGWGEMGQLTGPSVNATRVNSAIPVVVQGIENAVNVTCGYQHSCALIRMSDDAKIASSGKILEKVPSREEKEEAPLSSGGAVSGMVGGISAEVDWVGRWGYVPHPANGPVQDMGGGFGTVCWGDGMDMQLQRHHEVWISTARQVMRLNEALARSDPEPTAPLRSVW